MRMHGLALIFAGLACAADMPTGYFHGTMLAWSGTPAVGILSAKARNGGGVFECHYDAKTYFEFEKRRAKVDKYIEGDPLELLVHRRPGESTCFILSGAIDPPPKVTKMAPKSDEFKAAAVAKARNPVVQRHGTQRVSGVITQIADRSFTLRTRDGESRTYVYRLDTRFVGEGFRLQQTDVKVNQRVEVEVGRNAEGEMEAFQLTWGTLSVQP